MTVLSSRNFVQSKSPAQLRYAEYLRGYRWRWYVRPLSLRLDGYACKMCSSKTRLEVHHPPLAYKVRGRGPDNSLFYQIFGDMLDIVIRPFGVFQEAWRTTTLCHDCHSKHHGKYL